MSTIAFTPATRANVPLLLGFSGGTGSGKTYSAMRLASGMAAGKPFAVIDTETGRARHYADMFKFDHAELLSPFRPDSYLDAIIAADAAGYPVVVVDSMSHVWAGEGGVLDWHEEELDRMAGTDWKRREGCKMAAWIKPKVSHKKMVQRLLQVRTHVILCFRAEQKVEMTKDERGKTVITAKASPTGLDGWIPICDKNLPFELTASFLLTADAPGIAKPIKLQQQHRNFFSLREPVTEETGRLLAEWARGADPRTVAANAVQSQATAPDASLDDAIWAAEGIGASKSAEGTQALQDWWKTLSKPVQVALKKKLDEDWKPNAQDADANLKEAAR